MTYTKCFYKLYSIFQFLPWQTNCFQCYHTIKPITAGTIPHYLKHANNVILVNNKRKKKTIMVSNYFTKAVTQKKSDGKMLQKYAAHLQKNTYADM